MLKRYARIDGKFFVTHEDVEVGILMRYVHDEPKSLGVINACKRARQMVELEWTPRRKVPCCFGVTTEEGRKQIDGFFRPWRPRKGVQYAGVREYEKYVGFNISLETFVSAVTNPNSVLYTHSLHGQGKYASAYYGTVCSAFVSYVLDLPYTLTCSRFPTAEGFSEIDSYDLNNLQLCDIILNSKHVVIITDILRDSCGNVCKVTVSESTPPSCISTTFSVEEIRSYYLTARRCKVYRYAGIDSVSYVPSPYVYIEGDPDMKPEVFSTLMTNFGNKANYLKGADVVELTIFENGWEAVEVSMPDGTVEEYPIVDGSVTIVPEKPGFHSACCVKNGERSHSVQWCVVDIDIHTDKTVYEAGEPIRVMFCNAAVQDKAVCYTVKCRDHSFRKREPVSFEEVSVGELLIEQNDYMQNGGEMSVSIVFQNEYGQYVSRKAHFSVNGIKENC